MIVKIQRDINLSDWWMQFGDDSEAWRQSHLDEKSRYRRPASQAALVAALEAGGHTVIILPPMLAEVMGNDPITETLKAIAEIRDSFPTGSEEWWNCVRWLQSALEIEREERQTLNQI